MTKHKTHRSIKINRAGQQVFCIFAALCVYGCYSKEPWKGTLYPQKEDIPENAMKGLEKVAQSGMHPYSKRNWSPVGLPEGLEEQVWKAWGPDAKPIWRNVSMGTANVVYDEKVENGIITVLLDIGGLVQSRDGGRTWKQLSHHIAGNITFMSFDISPADPRKVVVAGTCLSKTLDGGRSWRPIYDKALPVPEWEYPVVFGAVRFNADGSKLFAGLGALRHGFKPINLSRPEEAMAKAFPKKRLYIGNSDIADFKVLELDAPFSPIRRIVPYSKDPNTVYATFLDGSVYRCNNSKAASPVFEKLIMPKHLKDYQCIDMDIHPENPDEFLLVLLKWKGKKADFRFFHARCSGNKMTGEEVTLPKRQKIYSAKWNPDNPKEIFCLSNYSIFRTDNNLKTFHKMPLNFNKDLYHGIGWLSFRRLCLDRKTPLSLASGVVLSYVSRDRFKTFDDLFMVYDKSKKLYGNKGVGFAECFASVCICKDNTYVAINDHGIFRSNGKDTAHWRLIVDKMPKYRTKTGRIPWKFYPMYVSYDERFMYALIDLSNKYKLLRSTDKGKSWKDITKLLDGKDSIESRHCTQVIFDHSNSANQWILIGTGDSPGVFRSVDGGKSFSKTKAKITYIWRNLAFDPAHKILYASTAKNGIMKSSDMGETWSNLVLKPELRNVANLGVTGKGNLVIGTIGRLIVIPFNKIQEGIISPEMVKMTLGDTIPFYGSNLRTFKDITCDGDNVLVVPNAWAGSTHKRQLGPLISRDGGKTFKWLVYNLPYANGGVAIRNGKVMIGYHEMNLNRLHEE